MKTIIASLFTLLVVMSPAAAKRLGVASECNVTMPCDFSFNAPRRSSRTPTGLFEAWQSAGQVAPARRQRVRVATYENVSSGAAQIVAHPEGCPARLFCACGVAVRVFGTPRRDLWLAAAWLRFPRAAPAAGMVAARHGHAFYIEQVLANGHVIAYDANSGHGLTRIHERSLAGYTVVNPRGV